MKYFKRYFSVFLCCLLLSLAFSVNANATPITVEGIALKVRGTMSGPTVETGELKIALDGQPYNYTYYFENEIDLQTDSTMQTVIYSDVGAIVAKKDKLNRFVINGISPYFYVQYDDENHPCYEELGYDHSFFASTLRLPPDSIYVSVLYTDGTYGHFSENDVVVTRDWSNQKQLYNYSFEFTPYKDVEKIFVNEFYQMWIDHNFDDVVNKYFDCPYYGENEFMWGMIVNDSAYVSIEVDEQSEESGFLSGIFTAVKEGFKTVSNGFSNILSKIGSVIDLITDLPSKIWEFIENGLKSLFIPDEQFIVGYKDKWDQLMSDRFGGVYQAGSIILESWDGVINAAETDQIEIPEVCIGLGTDCEFSFGGYMVDIVPDGFEFIVGLLKTVVGICASVLFINAMRAKYEEVMGVEK